MIPGLCALKKKPLFKMRHPILHQHKLPIRYLMTTTTWRPLHLQRCRPCFNGFTNDSGLLYPCPPSQKKIHNNPVQWHVKCSLNRILLRRSQSLKPKLLKTLVMKSMLLMMKSFLNLSIGWYHCLLQRAANTLALVVR